MGIEEMINEYKKQIENNMKYIEGEWACEADRISGMKIAVDVLRKIVKDLQLLKSSLPTQQDKVVVPEFVAEWYEALIKKGWSHVKIVRKSLHELEMEYVCYTSDVDEWLNNEGNQELLISMKDGYNVKKEQLYYVAMPFVGFLTDSYDNPTTRCKKDAARSTEKEIKSLSLDYWAFAVPVEEESQ